MFMFARYVLLLSSLIYSLWALPLVPRDVVDPPITSPTASSVWHVGQSQTVTWSTTGLPVNQTNPVGMLVLGYMYNNSENLMLNSPLATNISYSVGHVQITVPNVPTRNDYIVVLFGDSGNASPEFTIINDASSSTSLTPSPTTTMTSSGSSSAASTSTSTTSRNNTGQYSSTPVTGSSQSTNTSPIATAPSSQATTVHSSTTVIVTASATPSSTSTQSSAAWQKHVPGLGTSLSVSLALIYFAFS